MRKFFALILCLTLLLSFAACSAKRPSHIPTVDSGTTFPPSVTFSEDGIWPDNGYTQDVPEPPGAIGWTMLDDEKESFGVQIGGITRAQFDTYYEKLRQAGFCEVKRGKGYISIGTVLSNGSKSISLAYAESVLMMTIVKRGVDRSTAGSLPFNSLTNVHINAYSTYDSEHGVQVVTQLYVPAGEKTKPRFSKVSGMVTICVGEETASMYLGSQVDAEAVGLLVNTKMLGSSGEKGFVVVAGTAYADNAVAGCGSFGIAYDITIP